MAEEKSFENKIKRYLTEQKCYYVKYFANRMTKVGVPDILASVSGQFVGIEVKSTTGTPSDLQIYNIKKIHDSGGFGVVVSPEQFEEFQNMIVAITLRDYRYARGIERRLNAKFF